MKKLEYRKFKNLHIICKVCKKSIEINQSEYKGCKHPIEKQRYKAVISINGERKTKDLKSLEYDEAIKELLDFKHELSNPIKISKPKKQTKSKQLNINGIDEVKYEKFIDCVMMYSDYLDNIDVPFFEQRPRSDRYKKDTIGYILKFRDYLENQGYNIDKLTIYQIDKHIVSKYFESLYKTSKSNATYNHNVRTLKSFYKFLIEKKGYELFNPMQFAKLKNVTINAISVDDNDFDRILNCIDDTMESDTIHTYKNGVTKKMYRPYIKFGIELVAYTGMRLVEALSIKYSDIVIDENGEIEFVSGIDIKHEKAHNYDQSKPVKYVPIPISPELEDLLNRLDYKQHINEDRYLIGPDELISRESMAKQFSHSFKFYRDKAGVTAKIGLKHLRKTFLTKIQISTGMVTSLGYQKTASVIEKNYLDKGKIAKSVKEKGFRLFENKNVS